MKTIYKILSILALLIMPTMAFASTVKPCDIDDTIPAEIRYENYYYTKWFDECPNFYPNGGVVDSCFCKLFQYFNRYPEQGLAKWEHTNQRMKVKGLVAMVSKNLPPYAADSLHTKLPEYLYLYQVVGRHYALLQDLGIMDGLDLELLDSVRWDTATARVMELRRGWNGEYTQYCYLYEAYFENPVYVDSDFYIRGSVNSNVHIDVPGSHIWQYETTNYMDIMDMPGWYNYALQKGCDANQYDSLIHSSCVPQGGWVAHFDKLMPQMGWYMIYPESPWGYYLAIVDQWNLDAVPNDTAFGAVLGGGRWPDDTYDTIEAYAFYRCGNLHVKYPEAIYKRAVADGDDTQVGAPVADVRRDDEVYGLCVLRGIVHPHYRCPALHNVAVERVARWRHYVEIPCRQRERQRQQDSRQNTCFFHNFN